MAQTSINIHMDGGLKKQFDAFYSDVGMSISTTFCMLVKTAVRERRIPLEIPIEEDPFYNIANMARLKKSIAEMKATGGAVHEVKLDDWSVDKRCVGRF